MNVIHYLSEDGVDLFQRWLDKLNDHQAKVRILRRLDRLAEGNPGDCRPCQEGMSELRIDYGPGYRIYFFQHGFHLVVLLCGGDKRTQDFDINQAVVFKADYLKRLKENDHD